MKNETVIYRHPHQFCSSCFVSLFILSFCCFVYLCPNADRQSIHVNNYVQQWFAGIRIEVRHTFAKFINVIREQLIGVRYSIVQIGHFIVCEISANEFDGWFGEAPNYNKSLIFHLLQILSIQMLR